MRVSLIYAYEHCFHGSVWSHISNTAYPFARINPGGPQAILVVVGAMTVYIRAPSQLIKFMTMVTDQTGWPLR